MSAMNECIFFFTTEMNYMKQNKTKKEQNKQKAQLSYCKPKIGNVNQKTKSCDLTCKSHFLHFKFSVAVIVGWSVIPHFFVFLWMDKINLMHTNQPWLFSTHNVSMCIWFVLENGSSGHQQGKIAFTESKSVTSQGWSHFVCIIK